VGTGELKATADAGPLIHLAEIGCLRFLNSFDVLHIKGISILLTDDMAVRDAARHLHIVPVGSLGIVVSAFKQGELTLQEAESYIGDLYGVSSFFLTRAIAELAIEQLRSAAE